MSSNNFSKQKQDISNAQFYNQSTRTYNTQSSFQPKPFVNSINKPLPPRPQNFLTNKQVFGMKPPSTMHKQQYRPTPMSVQTRTTNQQRPYNHFQPVGRPTFISEELFNTETNQTENYENLCETENINEYRDLENQHYIETENFQTQASENTQ